MILMTALIALGFSACNTDGCTDSAALNYDPNASSDDGSCVYVVDNLSIKFHSKMGTENFAFNTEVTSSSGRKVRFTRAQMYVSGFTFSGPDATVASTVQHLLLKTDQTEYNLGYLPDGTYSTIRFSGGVDSVSNHLDPASFPSNHALSANNPNHIHWGWDPGYIFYVVEGMVDTTETMSGPANAPFVFHVGGDSLRVDMAFAHTFNPFTNTDGLEINLDWLALLNGTNMTADVSTRSTHTTNNPELATLMASNIDAAFSMP